MIGQGLRNDLHAQRGMSTPRLNIGKRSLERLTSRQRELLDWLAREPMDYVDNPRFSAPDAEREIMAPVESAGDKPIQRFIQAFADPIGDSGKSGIPRGAVLTATREQALFMQYNYCRYRVAEMHKGNGRKVMPDELGELLGWYEKVLDVRDQLAHANMPLVLAMAKRVRLNNVDFSELISAGNMALLRAIERFDVARGFKFSTYGCRAILKAFNRVCTVQSRYRERFPAEFDPCMEKGDFAERRRESLEADCVEQLREIIARNGANLNAVEQVVIRERFAIHDQADVPRPKTLGEIGQIIGVTKERVRQIQNKVMFKLRAALEEKIRI